MSVRGVFGQPYLNLDSYLDMDRFNSLFNEMVTGIAKSWVDKGVVSCGVRPDEKKLELCQVLFDPKKFLNDEQAATLETLSTLHQKAWYCTLILPIHHPYSLVFIRRENDFWKKQFNDNCDWTPNAQFFPKTIEFIKTLPFEQIGRILLFITEPSSETLVHFDGGTQESRDNPNTEMIYFRPLEKKKLFIWDEENKKRHELNGQATFWNDMDWHGVLPTEGKTFSLRIDGVFKEEFREKLRQHAKA